MRMVVAVAADTMGRGNDELGGLLMANFLRKLWASPTKPGAMVFYNTGVRLLADGSPALDALEGLAAAGVELVACGTCIAYFDLSERLRAGRIGDMREIVDLMTAADKVMTV